MLSFWKVKPTRTLLGKTRGAEKKEKQVLGEKDKNSKSKIDISKTKIQNEIQIFDTQADQGLNEIKLIGLYEPEKNDLNLDKYNKFTERDYFIYTKKN